jgi:glycosyltransferase involved in cell wall biosynthesis
MEIGTVKAEETTHAGEHSHPLGSEAVMRAANEGDVELSIVMPCLNEAETLGRCIEKAKRFLKDHQVVGEIIIGDNGSTDGSQALAEGLGARVVPVKTRGYGAAVFYASIEARGRYILMGDSDDSYDFTAIAPFLRELRAGYDLVMGNRFKGGIRPGAMPWKNRYLGNPILSATGRLFFRCPARDFHCGLRGYSAEAFRRMDLRTTGMEFASEMVIRATLAGMRITEVSTTLDPDGRSRPPHLRPWRDGWRHLRFMLLFSPRWLFLIPGVLMMICGVGMAAFLWQSDRLVFGVHLGVHTVLYAAAMASMGYQATIFSVFAKVFAISEGLLPEDKALTRLFKYVTLESGLTLGLLLVAAGVAGTISAFHHWSAASFGPLHPEQTLRLVIVAAFSLMLGTQTILSSFFLSVLGLGVRRS